MTAGNLLGFTRIVACISSYPAGLVVCSGRTYVVAQEPVAGRGSSILWAFVRDPVLLMPFDASFRNQIPVIHTVGSLLWVLADAEGGTTPNDDPGAVKNGLSPSASGAAYDAIPRLHASFA